MCTCAQVHLTVDTAMDTGSLSIAAYIARKLNLGEQKLARKFQEVECEIGTEEIETVGGANLAQLCPAFKASVRTYRCFAPNAKTSHVPRSMLASLHISIVCRESTKIARYNNIDIRT